MKLRTLIDAYARCGVVVDEACRNAYRAVNYARYHRYKRAHRQHDTFSAAIDRRIAAVEDDTKGVRCKFCGREYRNLSDLHDAV